MTPSSFDRAARRTSIRVREAVAADVLRLRADAGLSLAELSRGSGVDASYIARIERAAVTPSFETYARIAGALGADLAVRLYPNTGPAIRDRHQAGILEALLSILHPRWRPYPEVAVRRPSRGWIDVGLHDPRGAILVATEIQSELRRLEQIIRWSAEKAASMPSWEGWPRLGHEPSVSQLLIVRDTRTTRSVGREYRRTLDAAFPGHPGDALAALTGFGPWPGSAVLWAVADPTRGSYRLISRR